MTFAPLTAVDRAQLLRVWNEAAEFDRLTPELLAEKLDREPARDESLSFARLEEDAVIGWATCVLRESADGVRGVVKMLAVAPQFQGDRKSVV